MIPPSFATFVQSLQRHCTRRAIPFEQYAASKGVRVPPDYLIAEVIGGALMPGSNRTATSAGKYNSKIKQLAEWYELRTQYEQEIPFVAYIVPLDFTKEADRAYARSQYRRLLRQLAAMEIINDAAPEPTSATADPSETHAGPDQQREGAY